MTNIPLPEASILMGENIIPFGGWLVNASEALANIDGVKLGIAFPKQTIDKPSKFHGKKIEYFAFPPISNRIQSIEDNSNLNEIVEQFQPDLIHIFGTEFIHTLSMVNIGIKKNVKQVISIQGLVSVIAKHYMAGVPRRLENRYTFRDFIKQDNVRQQRNKFVQRGKYEIEALQKVKHVIGRTTWDRACTSQINPNIQYHQCNETLRNTFYSHQWDINHCEKYSIFLSQGSYPIKGLHFMIEAMPLILRNYPNAKLFVGGIDITKSDNLRDKLKISSYGKYIKDLIKKNNLHSKVNFMGVLDEKQMCNRYLDSHIFVCPSSIENSPNSLGEAMILGVPSVAADVGGIADMLKHQEEGYLYQGDAPYMLAHYVNEVFSNDDLALRLSRKSRERALFIHNKNENNKKLYSIYQNILNE